MIRLIDVLNEDYGSDGKFELPENHQAGMKVTKGGSSCSNCKFYKQDNKCGNKYYIQWAQTDIIPEEVDEYCSDWWEPINKLD